MNPVVSVLLLTFNHKAYIAQAINSVLEQITDFDFEILIGDDCSTDGTAIIVGEFKERYPEKIQIINSENNVGAIKNEQRLMDAARGKYIAFLEGDDFWVDNLKLQKQVDFLETHPDYGLVHGDVNHYFEKTGKTNYRINKSEGIGIKQGYVFNELFKPNPLFIKTATTCFRKDLIKSFDYDLAIKENWPLTDLPLWMDISFHSKVHYFNEALATYRLLNESASRTASPEKKYTYFRGLYHIKQTYLSKYNCSNEIKMDLQIDYYRSLIRIAFLLNDFNIANEALMFIKKNSLKISLKEQILIYSAKYKFFRKIIIKFKP